MILTVSNGIVPAGSYSATFDGVEIKASAFGPGLSWQFTVASGPYAGSKVTAMTPQSPTHSNKAGRFVSGLLGRALQTGEQLDLSQCRGKKYLIVVAQTEKGGSKVETVTALPTV